MDRYSLQAIAAEAMNHTNEVVTQQNYLLQDVQLQRRIDSVRNRIRSMRDFARERAVNLEEIPEVSHLERALDACPLAPVRDEISESLSSPESNSNNTATTSEATSAYYGRDQEPEVSQDRGVEGGGRVDRGYASSSGISEAISSDNFDEGRNRTTETTPKASSSNGSRLYKAHMDAFQNLSLGDVLSTAPKAQPRGAGSPAVSTDAYENSRDRRDGGAPTSSSSSSRLGRRGEQAEEVPSLGEVLATSRNPLKELREKIRLARQEQESEATEERNTTRGHGSTNRLEDFGGSLGDVLRPREESEFRDRRRFYNRSLHEQIEAEAETYLRQEQSNRSSRRSNRGNGDGGGSSSSGASDYANDKSLANRALCRLHRTRFTDTSETNKQECSICLEDFKYGQVLAQFGSGCKHKFHQTCICAWFKTGDTRCPLCRYDIMGLANG